MTRALCSIPGCEGPHYAHGWCVTHYRRTQRHGDAQPGTPVRARTRGGTDYLAARRHLVRTRGPASAHRCAECSAQAACWSYDDSDPEQRTDPARGTRYSLNPDHYRPRCRRCHRHAATARKTLIPATSPRHHRAFDIERAAALYRAGASCRGIGSLMGVSAEATRRALRAHGVALRTSGRPTHRRD